MDRRVLDLVITNILAVLAGLVVSGLLIYLLGKDPIAAYSTLLTGVFRDEYTFGEIFVKATPLIFTALAFALPFQAKLFNIGAQGQFYVGAIAASAVSLACGARVPAALALLLVGVAAIGSGALWAALIGVAKAARGSNEFLLSMMSTFVALALMNYLLRTQLRETKGEYPQTNPLQEPTWLPVVVPGTRVHLGFVLALLAAVGSWFFLYRTKLGFRVRATGANATAARLAGIRPERVYVVIFGVAGGLAGAAGFTEVNGVQHMLVQGFNPGVGAAGIGIAILANANPIGIVFAAILFGVLMVGGVIMGQLSGIPPSFIDVMIGIVMVCVILGNVLRWRLQRRREVARLRRAEQSSLTEQSGLAEQSGLVEQSGLAEQSGGESA